LTGDLHPDFMPNPLVGAVLLSAMILSGRAAAAQRAAAPFPVLEPGIATDPPAGSASTNRQSLTGQLWFAAAPSHRGRHALIGGLIGAATGIITCTAISNLSHDPGSDFSTCDAAAYLGFGLGGFAVGALIGWLIP
jgi:hypothetical protein